MVRSRALTEYWTKIAWLILCKISVTAARLALLIQKFGTAKNRSHLIVWTGLLLNLYNLLTWCHYKIVGTCKTAPIFLIGVHASTERFMKDMHRLLDSSLGLSAFEAFLRIQQSTAKCRLNLFSDTLLVFIPDNACLLENWKKWLKSYLGILESPYDERHVITALAAIRSWCRRWSGAVQWTFSVQRWWSTVPYVWRIIICRFAGHSADFFFFIVKSLSSSKWSDFAHNQIVQFLHTCCNKIRSSGSNLSSLLFL